jgi:hypothetical protein
MTSAAGGGLRMAVEGTRQQAGTSQTGASACASAEKRIGISFGSGAAPMTP